MNKSRKESKQKEVVAIYIRVSSAEQANSGLSLEMQKDECIKWAENHGYDYKIFEDKGKTATNINRPALKALFEFVKNNKVKYLLVWKLDRLTRSSRDFYGKIIPKIEKYNCDIASIYERFKNLEEVDELLLSIYLGHAEKELKNIKRRTTSVLKNRAEKGYHLGKAPVGYLNTRDEYKHGIIVPDPNKAHYIKRIFELYSTGAFSMEKLGTEMAKHGFKDSKDKPYPTKRIEDILKNPVYNGKVSYNEELFAGKHEPIISEELFHRIELMLENSKNKKPRGETYIYSNYIKCAKCGYSMIGTTKHGAHNSGTYIYYHCSNYTKAHKKEKNINENAINEAMQEVLDSFNISEFEIQKIKKQIFSAIDDLKKFELKSIEELEKESKKLLNLMSVNAKKALENGYSEQSFTELNRKWSDERKEIDRKITCLRANSKDTMTRISLLIDFANRIPELYLKATLDEKRLILSTITDTILYNEDTNTLQVKLKPVFEQLRQRKAQNKKAFYADVKSLTGTFETRSEKAKQTCKNYQEDLSKIIDYGTRKKQIQTKIEPHHEGSKKLNVVGGT